MSWGSSSHEDGQLNSEQLLREQDSAGAGAQRKPSHWAVMTKSRLPAGKTGRSRDSISGRHSGPGSGALHPGISSPSRHLSSPHRLAGRWATSRRDAGCLMSHVKPSTKNYPCVPGGEAPAWIPKWPCGTDPPAHQGQRAQLPQHCRASTEQEKKRSTLLSRPRVLIFSAIKWEPCLEHPASSQSGLFVSGKALES